MCVWGGDEMMGGKGVGYVEVMGKEWEGRCCVVMRRNQWWGGGGGGGCCREERGCYSQQLT